MGNMQPEMRADLPFFNRAEYGILFSMFLKKPIVSRVTIVHGPSDCGKTSLFRELNNLWKDIGLNLRSPMLFISGLYGPEATRYAIASELKKWLDGWKRMRESDEAEESFMEVFGPGTALLECMQDSVCDLWRLMDVLVNHAIDPNNKFQPIIIVDDVDTLKHWEQQEMERFLKLLLLLSKGKGAGHAVLITSDDLFCSTLRKYISTSQSNWIGIGNLSQEDALAFFRKCCQDLPNTMKNSWLQEWGKIYSVCGGSPLLLKCVAQDVRFTTTWDSSIEKQVIQAATYLEEGTTQGPSVGWTSEQITKAMKLLTSNSDGVVPMSHMVKKIGIQALTALVHHQYLHIRFPSSILRYEDTGSWKGKESMVMAKSPVLYAAMKRRVVGVHEHGSLLELKSRFKA